MAFRLFFRVRPNELLKCRLCGRIAVVVCLSILMVEMAILVPSYLRLKSSQYEELATEGKFALSLALSDTSHHSLDEILRGRRAAFERANIKGAAIYDQSGDLLRRFGESPVLAPGETSPGETSTVPVTERKTADGARYEVIWHTFATSKPVTVVLRMNAEGIGHELRRFILGIGALVFISSLFVATVTVVAHGELVLSPLLKMRANLLAAQDDPTNAQAYKLPAGRDDEIGETVATLNTLLDRVSEAHRSDVREREQRLQDFADASSDWFWEMDANLRFSYFSDRFTEVSGVSQEELLGRSREETGIQGVDTAVWQAHLADLACHRPFRDFQHPRTLASGRTVYLSINGKPSFDDEGKFKGYRGTGSDITKRKRTEEALEMVRNELELRVEERTRELKERETALVLAKDQAEIANRAKSEFLANMSHELRTPLNTIIGFAQIIADETYGPLDHPQYREYVGDIVDSGNHLLAVINDILDLSKIEAGNAKLNEEEVDVTSIIVSCARLVEQRAREGGLELVTRLPDGPLLTLRADPKMLKQILINLLSNAVKFTPKGGRVEVTAEACPVEGYRLQVADTGIGIAADDMPRALAQFEQVDGQINRKYEGTGLGLPLSKALVELHGGTLELESQVDVGTTVMARFPADRVMTAVPRRRSSNK